MQTLLERPTEQTGPVTPTAESPRIDAVRDVLVPIAVRAAEMLGALAVLAHLNGPGGLSLLERLTRWDSTYYAHIATNGYPDRIVIRGGELVEGARFAFSPLYPALVAVLRLCGLPTRAALLCVAIVSALALSVVVHLLARHVWGTRRAGYIASAAIGVLPMAIALQTGYADGLALALSGASILAALHRRWWWAGSLAFLATLARPTAVVVALAIPAAYAGNWRCLVTESVTRQRQFALRELYRPEWRRVVPATVLGVAGAPLFWLYVAFRSGRPAGWFEVQEAGWDSHFDLGRSTVRFLWAARELTSYTMVVFAACSILLVLILTALAMRRVASTPVAVVTIAAIAIALGSSNPWFSKPRILLAAFPLVVLLVGPLARVPTRWLAPLGAFAVVVSTWFGAYALAVWPMSA